MASQPAQPAQSTSDRTYSGRELAGILLSLFGLALLGLSTVMNPWVAGAVMGAEGAERADVLLRFFATAAPLGLLQLAAGSVVASGRAPRLDGAALALFLISSFLIVDRALLVGLGLPLWVYDSEIAYRNRPHKILSLARRGRPDAVVRINAYGHHDSEDFPVAKPAGEFRALMLGDSITMGDGVPSAETFSEQLEALVENRPSRFRSFRVINTGVNGYATSQELRILRESLRFQPDFVALGFCMNDVTDPFVNDKARGGVDLDYHGVWQSQSPLLGYLFNETGAGRLLQKFRARGASARKAKLLETYNIREMALGSRSSPRFQEAWKLVLDDLAEIHRTTSEQGLPLLLMVFPFTFQLSEPEARVPQQILADFARERGIDLIDFTSPFEARVFQDRELLAWLRGRGYSPAEIERFFAWRIDELFLDSDHLTAEGHRLVAEQISAHLEQKGLIAPARDGS